jgi:phenylalanine-4-hydroxylase
MDAALKESAPVPKMGSNYIMENKNSSNKDILLFSTEEEVGALAEALKIFKNHSVNLLHIESRSSKRSPGNYEFIVEIESDSGDSSSAIEELRAKSSYLQIISRDHQKNQESIPWFPGRIQELDRFANQILSYGSELDADHPGFTDQVYRLRRKEFADIAFNYKHGQTIPRVEYTPEEIATWGTVYRQLTRLYPTHACREFNHNFPLLV